MLDDTAVRGLQHQREDVPAAAQRGRRRTRCAQGLADGTIDTIATDHAPHHRDEKGVQFDEAAKRNRRAGDACCRCRSTLVRRRRDHDSGAHGRGDDDCAGTQLGHRSRNARGRRAGRRRDLRSRSARGRSTPGTLASKSKNTPFDGWELQRQSRYARSSAARCDRGEESS